MRGLPNQLLPSDLSWMSKTEEGTAEKNSVGFFCEGFSDTLLSSLIPSSHLTSHFFDQGPEPMLHPLTIEPSWPHRAMCPETQHLEGWFSPALTCSSVDFCLAHPLCGGFPVLQLLRCTAWDERCLLEHPTFDTPSFPIR